MIKMRCWNGELQKWDDNSYIIFDGLNPLEVIGFHDDNDNEQLIWDDGNAVVLFSGLTDNDGREMYVGDIYCYEQTTELIADGKVILSSKKNVNVPITFEKGAFYHGETLLYDALSTVGFKYVGDIYTNPELVDK